MRFFHAGKQAVMPMLITPVREVPVVIHVTRPEGPIDNFQ